MNKIITSIFKLSLVLMALSFVSQQVSATKGDVERALELLRQARAAIGGESTIGSVQSLSINGKSSRLVLLPDQGDKQLNGEFELNMLLPDKMIRIEKLTVGHPESKDTAQKVEDKDAIIRDVRVKVIHDGEEPGAHDTDRHSERSDIAYYMIGLLLTPPASLNSSYNYVGEGDVDGSRVDIIDARGANGFSMKLYLDRSSHLPLMMSYTGSLPRIPVDREIKVDVEAGTGEGSKVVVVRSHELGEAGGEQPTIIIEDMDREAGSPTERHKILRSPVASEDAEIQVRFSDFRPEGGLLLPHALTHLANGRVETVWTVESYEINSPTINDKFRKRVHWQTKQN